MNFKISRIPFLNELSKVARAISFKSPIFQLTGIKIEVKDNSLFFTGSDNELTIFSFIEKNDKINFEIFEEGSIVLSARYILDIVRKIDTDEINIEVIDGDLTTIKSNKSVFKLRGLESERNHYPEMDFSKPNNIVTLEAKVLKKLITQTIFATSEKETRPVLTGVNIKMDHKHLEFITTDSYRLAKKIIDINEDYNINITVPKKCLDEVSKMIEDNSKVEFSLNEKKVQFKIDNTIIQSRLIEGAYPETSRLIPTNFDHELVVESHLLIDAIDRALLMKSEGVNTIKLNMSEELNEISAINKEIGASSKETLESASFSGNKLVISFSGKYAIDAIRAVESDLVKISFSGEMRPFIVKGISEKTVTQLILPVKTYE